MSLEQAGVPSVAVHTDVFARLARATALANGMPRTRQAFVPQPVVDRSPAELRAYIEGNDPVSRRPFVQEILEGLTRPLAAEDLTGISFERATPRLLAPDSEENLQQLFLENHWTDFLPIVLPTEARVARMLAGTSHRPDEVVGRLRPAAFREFWEFTVEKVAVNAVMAGTRPEYFPVILALAASGVTARSSSTTSMANVVVVNGPIRLEIGMNSGIGALGPYNHANTTIGRAYNLLSQNLQGGSVPGETYMGSLGNANAYAGCFAENEERSPWEPLHVAKGFKAEDSTVSIFFGARYTISGYGPRDTWQERFRRSFAACEHFPPLLVIDPIVARGLIERGIATRQQLVEWCAANARLPAREYWDDQWIQTLLRPLGVAGVEPYATRLKAKPDEVIPIFEPGEINVVVVGGETQGAWKMIGARYERTVSVDAWR
ncbi:MAG TPA: UGSC family (seleno)protein [Stellaceae bacterium]|nr:UGSC family (seleno)protein [Stellaceae bacterium]